MIDIVSTIEMIMVAIAVVINSYLLYCIIRDHIKMIRMERMAASSKRYEWLYKAGLVESATFFNEWGFEQVKRVGYHIRIIRMERMVVSSKRYEWLYKAGLIETSMFFNEWGFEQVKRFGYPYE